MDKTAFLSVHDKTGLEDFARGLDELGFSLYASGSTYKLLAEAGVEAEEVRCAPPVPSAVLKALHGRFPALSDNGVELPRFYLVAADLYPISGIVSQDDFTPGELAAYLDQSNSAVLRAAARDFENVVAISSHGDYAGVLAAFRDAGGMEPEAKRRLAARAWQRLAAYDAAVAQYLGDTGGLPDEEIVLSLRRVADLDYGENPHQKAAFYAPGGARPRGLSAARTLGGGNFNLNHYLDLDTAFELAMDFEDPVCVIAKHARPTAVFSDPKQAECLLGALRCDPAGAVGGTAAFNRTLEARAADLVRGTFIESVAAPGFSPEALKLLRSKEGLRILELQPPVISPRETVLHSVAGGVLVEEKDNYIFSGDPACVTRRKPADDELAALKMAWKTVKYARTYGAVLAVPGRTLAVSAGESSTYDAVRGALWKMRDKRAVTDPPGPLVMAADAALPLKTLNAALSGGVTAVIQPGGWQDDRDCAELCDSRNAAMLFAGIRHFRH